jgi:hypothetical protein
MAAHRARQAAKRLAPEELERLAETVPPAAAESALVTGIAQAARADWKAAAFILERRWPERWSPTERTAASGGDEHELDWTPDAA